MDEPRHTEYTVETELHIDREVCVRSVQRTENTNERHKSTHTLPTVVRLTVHAHVLRHGGKHVSQLVLEPGKVR
jgi:hypothetical protein